MKEYNILIIDDEKSQVEILSGYLRKKGFTVYTAESGNSGIKTVKENTIDIIISDYKMPDKTGYEVLCEVKKINPEISFIIQTAYGTVENAVEAMQAGAYNYLSKPVDLDELDLLIEQLIERKNLKSENEYLREQIKEKYKINSLRTNSRAMEEAISLAARVAESKATVLITGENGTGKEVLAKTIHYISQRKEKPFIAVNVPAMSDNLIESELFGHEKGAFTGADKLKKGRFEIANEGTIFLDEIGDVPLPIQVKLLRVLQEQEFERIGGTETIKTDVRIIAATNQNLEQKVKAGTFREDLFYRLNVVSIHIPPLRERREDIPLLIDSFIEKYSKENCRDILELSKECVDVLIKYNYPGNVRELENIIERAVVLCRSRIISTADLPVAVRAVKTEEADANTCNLGLNEQVEQLEKKMIYDALKCADGNQVKAAGLLGLSERNLRYKLKIYGINNK